EHRLTEVISQPRDRNRPQTQVSFRYDPLGRRISKTRQQMLGGQPTGKPVTTRFVWEGFRLLQELHGDVPLTYVYSDQDSYDPLARIDGVDAPEIFWFHCQPNGTPERMTDSEGQVRWEGVNSAWGKLLRESDTQGSGYSQNLRMQGQYLDRETGLHYNLFRYYDPDCGRFTQQDPIGLAGGINLYQYAPNALGWIDPWGLTKCSSGGPNKKTSYEGVSRRDAFRQAKRDAGIPMNQHPRTISRPDLLDGEGNKILNSKGLPIKTRQYEFRDSNNKPVFIQEHSLGHDKATSGHGAEPHFNVRPPQNLNTGSVPGTHGHYNFEGL
ncbi:HNH/endonuclease VII fold putative polymorphic toxin, partial [Enterobacter sichuanensis]